VCSNVALALIVRNPSEVTRPRSPPIVSSHMLSGTAGIVRHEVQPPFEPPPEAPPPLPPGAGAA